MDLGCGCGKCSHCAPFVSYWCLASSRANALEVGCYGGTHDDRSMVLRLAEFGRDNSVALSMRSSGTGWRSANSFV
jgi:hypothetical protein